MRNIALICALLCATTGQAINKNNVLWKGIKWYVGGKYINEAKDQTFVKDKIAIDYDICLYLFRGENGSKGTALKFIGLSQDKESKEVYNQYNKELRENIEKGINFECKHGDCKLGSFEKGTLFIGDAYQGIETFSYQLSKGEDTLRIAIKRTENPTYKYTGDTPTPLTEGVMPEGETSIRGIWNFGKSLLVFGGPEWASQFYEYSEGLKKITVDTKQKGVLYIYENKSEIQYVSIDFMYWIEDNKIYLCNDKKSYEVYEFPIRLSEDGRELYIELTKSALTGLAKEAIKKQVDYH